MRPSSPGTRRYLYEHLFYDAVQRTQQATGEVITVSAARKLRADMDRHLAEKSLSMDDSRLTIPPVLEAIESSLSNGVEGYPGFYAEDTSSANPSYQRGKDSFYDVMGFSRKDAEGNVIQAATGQAGPRLPISPYDPRWATRSTVKQAGGETLFIADADVEQLAGGNIGSVHTVRSNDLSLWRHDLDRDRLEEAGPSVSADDVSGMTELMQYMSEREYRSVRSWVIDAGRTPGGGIDASQYMSSQALQRSTAILEELQDQGVAYEVKRDRGVGQIRAELTGTKLSVRLTDRRADERYVGRVYDDGIVTRYASNFKRDGRYFMPTPTASQAVDLLRVAQGLPVQRSDGRGLVGEQGSHTEYSNRSTLTVQDSYYSDDSTSMRLVGPYSEAGEDPRPGEMLFIHRDPRARSARSEWFSSETEEDRAKADKFLRDSVDSARNNFASALDVDGLIADYQENIETASIGEYFPEFSGDNEVAAIQRSYWDVLRGSRDTLLRPGATEEEYLDKVGAIGELQLDDGARQAAHDMLVADLAYTGTAEQKIRDHAADALDEIIGTHEPRQTDEGLKRFNAGQVSTRMTSEHGQWRNQSDLVSALRASGVPSSELMGTGPNAKSVRDRLITFDESTSVPGNRHPDAFIRQMAEVVRESVERNGGTAKFVDVDANGIVRYGVEKVNRQGKTSHSIGEIGQLFGRGEYGEIVTAFESGENYLFMPGYEARIVAQKPGETKSVEERTRLRGYEQIMRERIAHQVTNDMTEKRSRIGDPTTLNGVYRTLYDERHEPDFIERAQETGLSSEWVRDILATEGRRVRYASELAQGSTVYADWRQKHGGAPDPQNDNFSDPWILTGNRNMAIMTEESDGYFDPVMTNGSVYQGITRYLVEGAEVSDDGVIIPGPKDDRAPLMKRPETEYMQYDPYDRQQMTASGLLNATGVTEPTNTAMMTFGGWTADDPVVISKEFAEANGVIGLDGQRRPSAVGDKISDLHGNKGVISLIVDRDAVAGVDYDAEDQSLAYAHSVFKTNPDLDVVMSPFSAVSRFNGGTARELMDGQSTMDNGGTMSLPFKGAVPGAMGSLRFIVTHKDVESGTRVYDDEALSQGRGRKASSQLAWALGSQNCDKIMEEFYGPNASAATNFREMLLTVGLDMSADGSLLPRRDDLAEGSERRLFEMPDLVVNAKGSLNMRQMRSDFGALIGDRGGDLELPFPLVMGTGERTPNATDSSWKLPVMSSHLRSGQDLDDGVTTAHDYTNQYLSIHEAACKYRHALGLRDDPEASKDQKARAERMIARAPQDAQRAYDTIADDLKERRFAGKRNIFKEGLMSSRLPNSATAVWTSDPRLDLDQLAMGPAMAEALGFEDDDYALIWRDPVLRDGGVRYMRVAIDERLTSVAINPVMDKSFDGDFDGDSVAVVRLTSEAAKAEARQKLTVEANLLDRGSVSEIEMPDGSVEELHPLSMQDSLDVKVTQHVAPRYKDQFAQMTMRANEIHSDLEEGEIDQREALSQGRELMSSLSDYYREVMEGQYGDAYLRFDSTEAHLTSVVEACVETGAKGSMSKIADYARHLGADPQTYADLGSPQHTRKEDEGVMMATAVKSHGTGLAGTFSQRGVKSLRNVELTSVLELTYPVTQSVLQSKHDPVEAEHKYEMLMGPARELWRGRKLEESIGEDGMRSWRPAVDESGAPVQASPEEWKKQFIDLYTAKEGLNVSVGVDHVNAVAEAMTDPNTGKMLNIDDPESPLVHASGSTLDRLAYGGTFEDLHAAASRNENLFDGEKNGHFAPYPIRAAQQAEALWQQEPDSPAPEHPVLSAKDVLPDASTQAKTRGSRTRSAEAQAVRVPRKKPLLARYQSFDGKDDASVVHEGADNDIQMG